MTAINRQGVLFLWPIRLPGADGKIDDWSRSAMDAADEAKSPMGPHHGQHESRGL